MKKIRIRLVMPLLVVWVLVSCAGLMPQTPKDKSDVFMSYYLAQKANYEARLMAATELFEGEIYWRAGVTDLEKDILNAKYAFITEAEAPITLFDSYASRGELPPAELETAINAMMFRLKQYLINQQGG